MILILKGANFSEHNIGTLDSYFIQFSSNSGIASHNVPTSIKKNTSLSATITIKEGYELNGSVIVTMNDEAVTSGVTINGNTITISIASVTGNVAIKVPTKNTSTGEEDGGENENPDVGGGGSTGDRVYTIGETLKFNDMPEVASTFISDSYYKATDSNNPGSKLTVETRSGYKAWKNIRVYAGQSYALNPDARAICLYDADENAFAGFNLKNTYPDGVIPASIVKQDGWMSVTVVSSVSDDTCTIRRVS